ncbi:hypothetical protein BV898_17056 [Hypsibius exemplaris]|uniref:SAP domain-containing protein n=1 Tax=Hypsibius exemplaris TaxID=2072580 RepID=A0A9X6RLN4_HYPEX|nr:hypothetical protein BV898_17056 [Hypsibius exemplaris]
MAVINEHSTCDDLDHLTTPFLRAECEALGLGTTGRKHTLINNILEYYGNLITGSLSSASSPLEDIPEPARSILEVYHGHQPRTVNVSHPEIGRALPTHSLLPVSEKLRKKLMDQFAFIDLADLLPANRELDQSVFTRMSGESDLRRETISTY